MIAAMRYKFTIIVLLTAAVILVFSMRDERAVIDQYDNVNSRAIIEPDYSETVIPPNIGPLNFVVRQEGIRYYVKIYSEQGKTIEIYNKTPEIIIPVKPWHELLSRNKGKELYFDIFVRFKNGKWKKFKSINNKIAREEIDKYMVYRRIRPLHSIWGQMGIYQYDLENNKESPVISNESFNRGCVHCHTFFENSTDKMLLHTRSSFGPSMMLFENGKVSNFDSRTQFGGAPIGHTAWHPGGKMIIFTIYKVRQFFHSARKEIRDVVDLDSAMGYYLFESKTLKSSEKFSDPDYLETFPTWSPDGKYLYFCHAPILWTDRDRLPPENYAESRYSLMRISYDIKTDSWGELETVLSSKDSGLSITQPRISPDEKFLLFCMCQYSGFPAFQENSDLYMMDLNTGKYQRLACNSEKSESWHCFSSNSRWIVFSSKRPDGFFSKAYFSYIDELGTAYKPFVLAQEDPYFYNSHVKLYQMPELTKEPVLVTGESLANLIRSTGRALTDIPVTSATVKAEGSRLYRLWQGGLE